MFWASRYIERAIATIRVVVVTAHLELDFVLLTLQALARVTHHHEPGARWR
jgi:uncharacterized alpha-E superfamily protein